MDEVKCEQCPISSQCNAYKKAKEAPPYHPQQVIRAWSNDCPLVSLIQEEDQ